MDALLRSLSERWMPEQVIKVMFESNELSFDGGERLRLSSALPRYSYSSMSTKFAKAAGLERQIVVAAALFPEVKRPASHSPDDLRRYIDALRATLHMSEGSDFKANRLSREKRTELKGKAWVGARALPLGHRAYNKRFRFLARFEKHFASRATVSEIRELAQIAKSRLASQITGAMLSDLNTLCFIAYMTAKLNKRSTFTFESQERPYDEIAEMLFKRLGKNANWLAVAYVHPVPEVLQHLTEVQKGSLLGVWFAIMVRAAKVLDAEAKGGGIDMVSLIVRRGNDSSTWNEAAGAYNKARDGWINTLYDLGMEALLHAIVPGKAMRLMAADVAYGHQAYGSGLDPNTAVWNDLPKPWDVILHGVKCTRDMVENVCVKHKVTDKVMAGWLSPRTKSISEFRPTPELVHGVVVSSPELATVLKDAGYFGGPSKFTAPTREWGSYAEDPVWLGSVRG